MFRVNVRGNYKCLERLNKNNRWSFQMHLLSVAKEWGFGRLCSWDAVPDWNVSSGFLMELIRTFEHFGIGWASVMVTRFSNDTLNHSVRFVPVKYREKWCLLALQTSGMSSMYATGPCCLLDMKTGKVVCPGMRSDFKGWKGFMLQWLRWGWTFRGKKGMDVWYGKAKLILKWSERLNEIRSELGLMLPEVANTKIYGDTLPATVGELLSYYDDGKLIIKKRSEEEV